MNIGNFSSDYEIFYEYLVANDALEAFTSQCLLSESNNSNIIDHRLTWSATKEGHTYWSNLHKSSPKCRLNSIHFIKYCELRAMATLQTPYEFW